MNTKFLLAIIGSTLFAQNVPAMAQQHAFAVRETVGYVETRGWEQSLVQGDRNLSHWHWDPMYSAVQGKRVFAPSQPGAGGHAPPQSHYIRPEHVPTIVAPRPNRDDYFKEFRDRPDVKAKLSNQNLQGNLMHKNTQPMLASKDCSASLQDDHLDGRMLPPAAPLVASYGNNYGCPSAVSSYGSRQRAEVHARIKTSPKSKFRSVSF